MVQTFSRRSGGERNPGNVPQSVTRGELASVPDESNQATHAEEVGPATEPAKETIQKERPMAAHFPRHLVPATPNRVARHISMRAPTSFLPVTRALQ